MKRGVWILVAALLVGIMAFMITRDRCSCAMQESVTMHNGYSLLPELEWLRREFKLSDEQFNKVSALHVAYRPTCETLCAKIATSHQKVRALMKSGSTVSPELRAALQEDAALRVECQSAMLNHLYQTAGCMSPEQSRHYLDEMLPQVLAMPVQDEPMSHHH
jgi:hypothetical protein